MSDTEFFGDDGSNDPYWETLGHEEGAAEVPAEEPAAEAAPEPEAVEEPAVEETPDRPRDEHGRFVKAETETPSDDAETLRKRLTDQNEFMARQADEIGELRRTLEQIQQQTSRPQVSDWDSLIDENPAQAAQVALQAGDMYRYRQAKDAWDEIAPGVPELYEQYLQSQRKLAELEQQVTQTTAPIQQRHRSEQIAGVYQAVKAQHPDFDKFEANMAKAIDDRPLWREQFERVVTSGTPDEQFAFMSDLYGFVAGRATDTVTQAQTQAHNQVAEQAAALKQDAALVSATSTVEPKADKPRNWWDVAEADEQRRADGWQIS